MARVEVHEGVLEGEVLDNVLGGVYYSFKGIPYASPPIGDLRFKAPIPFDPWQGVRSAKCHGPVCHQVDLFTREVIEGSEDCLYLNVYTPDLQPKKPLPVMVFIHGGGYITGSGNTDLYGPDFLVKQGVILVTFNYRLEIFGFLCLETEDVPGNAGMKDQVAALRWIKKNISNFGGNSENITIFGESAGSSSVTFHLVSPMSKGLFNKAIAQSGCMLNRWASSFQPRIRAEMLAKKLGKSTSDDKELYHFFKSLPKEKLVGLNVPITSEEECNMQLVIQFSVATEKVFPNIETFFTGDVKDVLSEGIHDNVTVMLGYTRHEGSIALNFIKDIWNKSSNFNESFIPAPLLECSNHDKLEIGRRLKQQHFGKQTLTKSNLVELIDLQTLLVFAYDIIRWSRICVERNKNKIYLYEFAYFSERNIFTDTVYKANIGNGIWCSHGDDLFYIFRMADEPIDRFSKGTRCIEITTKLWTDFAKFGNPTPTNDLSVIWPTYDLENQHYLIINEELEVGSQPLKKDVDFWDNLCAKYSKS